MINISYLLKLIKQNESALKISGLYLIIGCLWILFSDKLAASFSRDTITLTRISLYKGWGYVLITALLLLWLIHRDWINLQDSEQRFRILFENNPLPMWLTDRVSLQFLEVNDAAIQHYGYSREEFMWMTESDLQIPEDRSTLTSSAWQEKFAPDLRHRCKDGRIINVQIAVHPFKLEDRQVGLSAITDISERKRIEEALRKSEAYYRAVVETQSELIVRWKLDGKRTFVNEAYLQCFGLTYDQAINTSFLPLVAEGDRSAIEDKIARLNAGQVMSETEVHQVILPEGRIGWQEWTDTAIRNEIGEIVEFQSVGRDVSERIRAEQALRESEERFRTLIEQSSEGIALVGEEGDILEWNQAMERITGISQAQAASLPVWDIQLQMIPSEHSAPSSADSVKALFYKALQTGNLPQLGNRLEVEIQTTRGERKTVTQTIFTIKTAGGYRIGSIVLDITERKHAEEALQQANQNLRLSYDATIEGWSNALDLRDKETEGHTQRVINLTMELARKMGISEADLVHVRRGALLHDIGKMGVPDHILLKADELTDEEWKIMRQHPVHAFNLLSRIDFLHPALDIPHYHHEKWDGTGYPDGLERQQIPLTARIFAIVDVWDALTSDRPYRKAWSEEKALDYICEQSGKYFDPQIVEKFLKLIGKKCNRPSGGM